MKGSNKRVRGQILKRKIFMQTSIRPRIGIVSYIRKYHHNPIQKTKGINRVHMSKFWLLTPQSLCSACSKKVMPELSHIF